MTTDASRRQARPAERSRNSFGQAAGRRFRFVLGTALLALGLAVLPGRATLPERVVVDSYEEFARGKSRSVSINDEGVLLPAPAVKKLGEADKGQVWSILPERDGSFLLATSPDGELLRLGADGTTTMLTRFPETHLYAMVRSPQGELFVATSPDGKIYRVTPGEQPEVWFAPGEKYIWCLLFDAKGVLYAGTGTDGKIYRITGRGKGEVFYDSDETHIRSLAWDGRQELLAGSGDNGFLYRVRGITDAVVLYATGTQEVNRIVVDPRGAVYFSGVGKAQGDAKPPTAGQPTVKLPPALSALMNNAPRAANAPSPPAGGPKAPAASQPSGPGGKGENSKLFRLDAGLFAETLWAADETILTLDLMEGRVVVGTGPEGYLYEVSPRGDVTRLLQVDGEAISAAASLGGKKFIVGTSNPIRIFQVGGLAETPGVYESEVFDSKLFARWGSVTLKSDGEIAIRTRSGNTAQPDKSWYAWQPLRGDQSQSPPGRYLQVELQLKDARANVDRLEVVYLPKNLPPRMERVDVLPPGVGYLPIVPPPQLPQPRTADQLIQMSDKGELPGQEFQPQSRYQPQEARGFRTLVWKANDPNNDTLEYNVYYSLDVDPRQWRLFADKLDDTVLSWDTSGWPDGNYYLKVEVTDAADNAPEEKLTDSLISKLMTVDNAPPVILITAVARGRVEFTVSDDASMLLLITVSRNGRDFVPLRPLDGILDGKTERFSAELKQGEVLFIRAQDEAGNVRGAMVEAPK